MGSQQLRDTASKRAHAMRLLRAEKRYSEMIWRYSVQVGDKDLLASVQAIISGRMGHDRSLVDPVRRHGIPGHPYFRRTWPVQW